MHLQSAGRSGFCKPRRLEDLAPCKANFDPSQTVPEPSFRPLGLQNLAGCLARYGRTCFEEEVWSVLETVVSHGHMAKFRKISDPCHLSQRQLQSSTRSLSEHLHTSRAAWALLLSQLNVTFLARPDKLRDRRSSPMARKILKLSHRARESSSQPSAAARSSH